MRTSKLIGLILVVVVVISLAAVWFFPSIQDFMAGNTMWNGVNDFMTAFNAKNIDSFSGLPQSPANNVLVSIPYIDYTIADMASMKNFVENGGTLVMMDDFSYGNSFLEYTGSNIRFDNTLLLDPLFNFKNEYLPRITDFSPAIQAAGIKVIGFNHATILTGATASQTVAWSSNMSYTDTNQNGAQDSGEAQGPFTVAAEYAYGKGTIELISDPSLIINTMVGQNDNNAFVRYMVNINGVPKNVLFDRSHLTKSPLDTSKIDMQAVLTFISNPYVLSGVIAGVFAIIIGYVYKRGLIIG